MGGKLEALRQDVTIEVLMWSLRFSPNRTEQILYFSQHYVFFMFYMFTLKKQKDVIQCVIYYMAYFAVSLQCILHN